MLYLWQSKRFTYLDSIFNSKYFRNLAFTFQTIYKGRISGTGAEDGIEPENAWFLSGWWGSHKMILLNIRTGGPSMGRETEDYKKELHKKDRLCWMRV